MGYSGWTQSTQLSAAEARLLHGAYTVCVSAEQFFCRATQQVASSNLRYKFLQLATLHREAAQRLPDTGAQAANVVDVNNELAAVQFWYLHQTATLPEQALQQPALTELSGLLQQQLRVLRRLTATLRSKPARVALAQLVAELQISNDQLQPLLKELPVARQ